jgi:uncharacterized protein (DUF3084 family)
MGVKEETLARLTLLESIVNNTLPSMHSQYKTMKTQGAQLSDQNSELQEEVRALEAKHASLQAVADTYNREFLDRGQPPLPGFWSR